MVAQGTFRNDLYYRLNVIPIHIPPLRQRREDIPVFVGSFLARYRRELRRDIRGLDPVPLGPLWTMIGLVMLGNCAILLNI